MLQRQLLQVAVIKCHALNTLRVWSHRMCMKACGVGPSISPYHCGSENGSDLPTVTQLGSSRPGICTWICLTLGPTLFSPAV